MTQTRFSLIARALLLSAALLLLAVGTASAQVVTQLVVSDVDTSAFPDITVTFRAALEGGGSATDLSSLALTENGEAIDGFTLASIEAGTEVIFAIDANESISTRDGGSLSRREKVRDVLNLFADEYMAEGSDLVSVIVPVDDEHPNGELLRNGIFINELKNAANFYTPDIDGGIDLDDVLNRALAVAAENAVAGRSQAIVLFSDGALEDVTLSAEAIVAQAQAQNVPIFVAILGARADDNEIANMEALTAPTGGTWVHMPDVAEVAPLLTLVIANRTQNQVTYRSLVNSSGGHQIALSLGGVTSEAQFEITVEPAAVTVLLDNSTPIVRVAEDPDAELNTIEPSEQAVLAQVSFPDDQPRRIISAALVVDGVILQAIEDPALGDGNTLDLSWDISELDAGNYNLAVEVTDELGLEGASEPLAMTIEVQRPQLVEATAEAGGDNAVVEVEAEENAEPAASGFDWANLTSSIWFWVVVGVVSIFGVILFFMLLLAIVRRSGKKKGEGQVEPQVQPQAALDAEATQILAPAFVQRGSGAYLEPMENASEHAGAVYLSGNNVAMGRDPKLAQIVFKDKSVSRLHARIMESNGEYRLYDEGSASGTYHNYERVGLTPQTLKDNDELHLGRVHLRFKMAQPAQDNDATQVFGPAAGAPPARPAPQGASEDLSTQPFMPHQGPGAPPAGPSRPSQDDNDADGTSTQPYMPHKPR